MEKKETLKQACDAVIADPQMRPTIDPATKKVLVTHCNQGARRVAQAMGCRELDDLNLTAEAMGQLILKNLSGAWASVGGPEAAAWAAQGGLAFAFMSAVALEEAHAHIATVYPAPMGYSGSLGRNVPYCANIGKQDAEELVTAAFPVSKGEPHYFTWTEPA